MVDAQRRDLLEVIKFCQCANRPMSVADVEQTIIAQRMFNDGVLTRVDLLDLSQMDVYKAQYGSTRLFHDFKAWVNASCDKSDHLAVAKCQPRSGLEAAACNPKVVSKQLLEIEQIMVELGIASGDTPVINKPACVFCTDEKGYSKRGMSKPKAVVTRVAKASATSATGDA